MENQSSKVKKLAKDVGLFAVSSFASKILIFLLTPLYTAVLTTEQYGVVDLLNTTVNFIYPVLTISIAEATLRFALDKNASPEKVLSNSLLVTVVSFFLVFLLKPFIRLVDESLITYWFYFVAIYCLNNFYLLLSNFLKGIGKTKEFAVAGIVQTVALIAFNILFLLVLHYDIKGYLLSIVFSYVISLLYMVIFSRIGKQLFSINLDKGLLKEMLLYSIPMIPTVVAWAVNTSIDKYMIVRMVGLSDNGIYSAAHKIPSILTTVFMIFLNAWQISVISNYEKGDNKDFDTKVYRSFNLLTISACFIILILNKWIARILFANDFYVAWQYVPFLIASALFSSLAGFMAAFFRAAKKTKSLFISALVSAAVNILLNYVLIKMMGTIGAAISTAVSFFVMWLIRFLLGKKICDIKINILKTIGSYLLFLTAVIFSSFNFSYPELWGSLLFLLFVLLNRKTMKEDMRYAWRMMRRRFISRDHVKDKS